MQTRKLLENYLQSNQCHNQVLCKEFIEFLDEPDCFLRSNLKRHFTASAFVFDPSESKALLIEHKKLKLWMQPGGHADGDENLFQVANKELEEECGLSNLDSNGKIFDIDRHLIPMHKDVPEHFHYDVRFLFKGSKKTLQLKANDELTGLAWFGIDEAKKLKTDESVLRMFRMAVEL